MVDRRFSAFACCLSVPEAFEHCDGKTRYKVVVEVEHSKNATSLSFQAVPHNALMQDNLRFVTWTRYSALFKVHKGVQSIHQQLHLRGPAFPDFVKPTWFSE